MHGACIFTALDWGCCRHASLQSVHLSVVGSGPMWMPGYSLPRRCLMKVVFPACSCLSSQLRQAACACLAAVCSCAWGRSGAVQDACEQQGKVRRSPVEYWPSSSTDGLAEKSLSFSSELKKEPNL